MASYKRRCKFCGKWIQLRQMPGGQWVAFEGYDEIHNCSKVKNERSEKIISPIDNTTNQKNAPYDNLDFANIEIDMEEKTFINKDEEEIIYRPIPIRKDETQAKNGKILIWLAIGILILAVLLSK